MRWGELAGLKIDRLHLEKGTIEVRQALVNVSGKVTFEAPKTPASFRSIRLTDSNVRWLKHHIETHASLSQRGLVFTMGGGGPALQDDNWRRRTWKPLVESIESVPDATRFHDLRHTHVALCIESGMNLKAIQVRLGQSSIRVTGDRYSHLLQTVLDRDIEALSALDV
jgi:integrase